jgi:hypothetical protein
MSEDNKALVRRWFAEIDKGNPTIEDELLPPDYIDHDPPLPGMAPGREGVKQANALLHTAFPDTVHTPTVSPLTIPLVYCHINSFQPASSVEKPLPGGENRREGRASPHEEW